MQQKFMQKKQCIFYNSIHFEGGERERKIERNRDGRERNRDKTVSIPNNNCAPLIALHIMRDGLFLVGNFNEIFKTF